MLPLDDCKRFALVSYPRDFCSSNGEDSTITLQSVFQVPRLHAASIFGLVVSVKNKNTSSSDTARLATALRFDIVLIVLDCIGLYWFVLNCIGL